MSENLIPIGILGGLALFIVLWDTLGPRGSGAKNSNKQTVTRNGKRGESSGKIPYAASSDFTALIHAIRDEGESSRDEQRREERGKKCREIVTIGLLFFTMCAITWQVIEMIKVYGPIKAQADAALTGQRAWVGPGNVGFEVAPVGGQQAKIDVIYINTGREPGTGFFIGGAPKIFSRTEWYNSTSGAFLTNAAHSCLALESPRGTRVVYPSLGGVASKFVIDTMNSTDTTAEAIIIPPEVAAGTEVMAVIGCLSYRSASADHHSAFCYFYEVGKTIEFSHLNVCAVGNDAD